MPIMQCTFRIFTAAQLLALITISLPPIAAQTRNPEQTVAPSGSIVLHASSQLVVVDIAVQDKNGRPVHGLQRSDFTLTEDKQPQTINQFDEHSGLTPLTPGQALPPMPPGTFTDYTAVPPDGALNVLLIDTLNASMTDQAYVRNQLQQYIKKAKPGTRIAIFGLSSRLFMLQGFSSDPSVLKNAIEHKLTPRASNLLDDAVGAGDSATLIGQDAAGMQAVSTLQQFESNERAFQTQLRIQYTLDAFNQLAHYLSSFPGRKNLIWFSGSFPLDLLPDPAHEGGFALMENNNPEFHETISLLSRARVAVYPVDAGGLRTDPTFSAATKKSDPFGKNSRSFQQSRVNANMTMNQLAEDTGGAAFYDTNDLAGAAQQAIESGSNYYTLTYAPANRTWKEEYREIRVTLNGSLQAAGYRLAYRHGYYADDPNRPLKSSTPVAAIAGSTVAINSGDTYWRTGMVHGAPTPQEILFKVRVLPAGAQPEQALAPDNQVDPSHPIKPPFRRFSIDVAAVGSDFHFTPGSDDRHTGAMEFGVFLYDDNGQLLNTTGKTAELNLTPEAYKRFLSGVTAHFEISIPAKGGPHFLRIGVRDISANRFGAVELPVASVTNLRPADANPDSISLPAIK
jgi:VWFA-related protein